MVNLSNIDPNTLTLQTISSEDVAIIPNTLIESSFNPAEDKVEYFVYDYNNNILSSNYDLRSYTPIRLDSTGNILEMGLNPEKDSIDNGYNSGIIKSIYNFITPELGTFSNPLFISEISPSRTELKLSSNNNPLFLFPNLGTGETFANSVNNTTYTSFKQKIETETTFDEFYLNFGNNIYVLGVNNLLEVDEQNQTISLLVKLYEPLPQGIELKTELSLVTKTAESVAYQLEFESSGLLIGDDIIPIGGPNYNIPFKDETGPLTEYKTYTSITSTSLSGSLFQLINNISSSSPELSVDYSEYDNFVFFSSANERLINFKNKLISISSSQAQLDQLYSGIIGPDSGSIVVSSSKIFIEKQIQTTINSFDAYENYLYYESGSTSWPKEPGEKPYILFDPTSSEAIDWYNTQSIIASVYDNENQNNLEFAIPAYIRDNSSNNNYMLFTNMIGQFFDEIWLYTQAITDKLEAESNLYQGVSKDLVSTVLESLGTKIYDSTYTLENIYSSLIGLSADGGLYPSTGSEMITNYVTSSISSSQVPTIDDFVKLSYKKIYHSLPYLLKKKGTNEGLRTLINIFGIPNTILRISEFGGKDKNNINDWDYWQHVFNYKFNTRNTGFITTEWQLNSDWHSDDNVPQTLEFKFQTPGLEAGISSPNQVLWSLDNSSYITLEYTGSGYTSGSYSGSIPDTYNQYATLKFVPDWNSSPNDSASIYLPFYDGGWWSVAVTKENNDFILYAANNLYSGSDGSQIGFTGSASLSFDASSTWNISTYSYYPSDNRNDVNNHTAFSGSYQEIRYYNTALSQSVFDDFVMNPQSIEGNGINSSPNQLAFRAPLGNDLYTGSVSTHPKVTGSWAPISSFGGSSNSFIINNGEFVSQTDYVFYDQIPSGIKNVVSNKIQSKPTILPYTGSLSNTIPNTVLSPFIQVQQNKGISGSYTQDINYVEVALSPQNEINENINSSIGYFNIGEYIGDPRLVSSSAESYPELDILRDSYFEKYVSNYNLWDYIRLIRYYDNALFKMVKDYVPVRSSVSTGIVIKQHILERNKYPVPQLNTYTNIAYSGSSSGSGADTIREWNKPFSFQNLEISGSSIIIETTTGSNGGSMPNFNGETSSILLNSPNYTGTHSFMLTQSWSGFNDTKAGLVAYTSSTQHEFFDGELSGSILTVTNGELNPECDPYKEVNTEETYYLVSGSNQNTIGQFEYYALYAASGSGEIHLGFSNTKTYIPDALIQSQSYDFQVNAIAITIPDSINGVNVSNIIPNCKYIKINTDYSLLDFNSTGWSPAPTITTQGGDIILEILTVQRKTAYPGLNDYYLIQTVPSSFKVTATQDQSGVYSTGSILITNHAPTITVFEPYVTPAFQNSNCNVIMNNALIPREDEFFFDVDYSSNAIVAVNTQQILSSSATPSQVQYSNYTLARQTYPRYFGSKNTSLKYNEYTPSGSFYTDNKNQNLIWGGDQSFGKTAAIDQYGNFGLYYNGGGVADLLNYGPNTIYINTKFGFDNNGLTYEPNIDTPYYWNGLAAFGDNQLLSLIPYSSESVDNRTLAQLQQSQISNQTFLYLNSPLTSASGSMSGSIYFTNNDGWGFWWQNSGSIILTDTKNQVQTQLTTAGNPAFSYGASSPTVLTASALLSQVYTQNVTGSRYWEQPYLGGGNEIRKGYDDPTTNVNPQVGQYVYFVNMQNEFQILNVATSGSVGASGYRWLITLDKPLTGLTQSDIDKFIFINYLQDTSKIYIDTELSGSNIGKGFILSPYTSPQFQSNFNTIIQDFKSKALI